MVADSERTTLIHDLRNQLNNIVMNAELAKLELLMQGASDDTDSDTLLECIQTILDAGAISAKLVDALSEPANNYTDPPAPDNDHGE